MGCARFVNRTRARVRRCPFVCPELLLPHHCCCRITITDGSRTRPPLSVCSCVWRGPKGAHVAHHTLQARRHALLSLVAFAFSSLPLRCPRSPSAMTRNFARMRPLLPRLVKSQVKQGKRLIVRQGKAVPQVWGLGFGVWGLGFGV
jgi:hypothetical protein